MSPFLPPSPSANYRLTQGSSKCTIRRKTRRRRRPSWSSSPSSRKISRSSSARNSGREFYGRDGRDGRDETRRDQTKRWTRIPRSWYIKYLFVFHVIIIHTHIHCTIPSMFYIYMYINTYNLILLLPNPHVHHAIHSSRRKRLSPLRPPPPRPPLRAPPPAV